MIVRSDIRADLCPVRNQGRTKPTCLAFAASAANEKLNTSLDPLCAEWLYYHSVQIAGDPPDAGSTLQATSSALAKEGQPFEDHWPYCEDKFPDPWEPPNNPKKLFFADSKLLPVDITELTADLSTGVPTILAAYIDDTFLSWNHPSGHAIIPNPTGPRDKTMGHAFLAVGYGELSGQTYFLIRNSWGVSWGDKGHAWVSSSYLIDRVYGTMKLKVKS